MMKELWIDFMRRPWWRKVLDIVLVLFAIAGVAIIGAWGVYRLGLTNNRGAVDKNYRYLLSVSEMEDLRHASLSQVEVEARWAEQLARMAALARFYPENVRLILHAAAVCNDPLLIDRMVAAAALYMDEDDTLQHVADGMVNMLHGVPQQQRPNAVPWMVGPEWEMLKVAIVRDSALIHQAANLTGVEARLIVGCLIGEQIRLFNSKREIYKQYLGPVRVLSVQSRFSYGVNGIKEPTAELVEEHLRDPQSEYYMGVAYEHLLDFETEDHVNERYKRLVDFGNHLYSYIYTGLILHQTMLQWRRAGYDISDRPDILFTLFNIGFEQSVPKPNPVPGGSHITIGDREYTFGAIGFDFYYSGELVDVFPYQGVHFATDARALTDSDIAYVQSSMSDCRRPERGWEYRQDSVPAPVPESTVEVEPPDPFGINPEQVRPVPHTAQ